MTLYLHTIKPTPGLRKKKQRVGRGGKRGTYSGRGLKGQKARSGGKSGLKRRGMRQLMESSHKLRGFKSIHKKPEIVNLESLNDKFKDGDKITPIILRKKGLVDRINNGVKILGKGEIKVKLEISQCLASKSAKEKIEKAGGKVN
ncbi:MAG: 50S ribosomal protein L15 [Candidatus Kuenenbacteria bacterium]